MTSTAAVSSPAIPLMTIEEQESGSKFVRVTDADTPSKYYLLSFRKAPGNQLCISCAESASNLLFSATVSAAQLETKYRQNPKKTQQTTFSQVLNMLSDPDEKALSVSKLSDLQLNLSISISNDQLTQPLVIDITLSSDPEQTMFDTFLNPLFEDAQRAWKTGASKSHNPSPLPPSHIPRRSSIIGYELQSFMPQYCEQEVLPRPRNKPKSKRWLSKWGDSSVDQRSSIESHDSNDTVDVPAGRIIKFLREVQSRLKASAALPDDDLLSFDTVISRLSDDRIYDVEMNAPETLDNETFAWITRKFSITLKYEAYGDQNALATSLSDQDEPATPSVSDALTLWRRSTPILSSEFVEQVSSIFYTVDDWGFDIFALQQQTNGHALLVLAFTLFVKYDLISSLGINENTLFRFLSKIENGYHPNVPYHNSVHAADVLHCLHHIFSTANVRKHLTALEILSGLFAAIVHDFEHPGLSNNFQIATNSPLALKYNDQSVLENFHISSAWQVLLQPEFNFIAHFSPNSQRKMRDHVVLMVVGTDMGRHSKLLGHFKARLEAHTEFPDPEKPEDLQLVLTMSLKLADISTASRPRHLYLRWVEQLCDEFFQQGDKEREHSLPISPFMDRTQPAIAKSQVAFIDFVVDPMFTTFAIFAPAISFAFPFIAENKKHFAELLPQQTQHTSQDSDSSPS